MRMDLDALDMVDEFVTTIAILEQITTNISVQTQTHDQVKDLKRSIRFLTYQLGRHVYLSSL